MTLCTSNSKQDKQKKKEPRKMMQAGSCTCDQTIWQHPILIKNVTCFHSEGEKLFGIG